MASTDGSVSREAIREIMWDETAAAHVRLDLARTGHRYTGMLEEVGIVKALNRVATKLLAATTSPTTCPTDGEDDGEDNVTPYPSSSRGENADHPPREMGGWVEEDMVGRRPVGRSWTWPPFPKDMMRVPSSLGIDDQ